MIRAIACVWLIAAGGALADDPVVVLQSTTSTQNSGLYDTVLPLAEAALDLDIRVVAVGTGQALRNASRCDADLVLTHAPDAEAAFVAAGYGLERHPLMQNDFVLIGPMSDPAGVDGMTDIAEAFAAIAAARAPFASRGDDSGTHRVERRIWTVDVAAASGTWYRETGAGMGATLNIAVGMGAYTLSDRATWLAFANPGDHRILLEGDPRLLNTYALVQVDPTHCPNVNAIAAAELIGWLLSADGQAAITSHRVGDAQVFFPIPPTSR